MKRDHMMGWTGLAEFIADAHPQQARPRPPQRPAPDPCLESLNRGADVRLTRLHEVMAAIAARTLRQPLTDWQMDILRRVLEGERFEYQPNRRGKSVMSDAVKKAWRDGGARLLGQGRKVKTRADADVPESDA